MNNSIVIWIFLENWSWKKARWTQGNYFIIIIISIAIIIIIVVVVVVVVVIIIIIIIIIIITIIVLQTLATIRLLEGWYQWQSQDIFPFSGEEECRKMLKIMCGCKSREF